MPTTEKTRLYDANDGDHEARRCQRRRSRGSTTTTTTMITRLYDANDGDHAALRLQRRRSRGSTVPTTEITRFYDCNDGDREALRLRRRRVGGTIFLGVAFDSSAPGVFKIPPSVSTHATVFCAGMWFHMLREYVKYFQVLSLDIDMCVLDLRQSRSSTLQSPCFMYFLRGGGRRRGVYWFPVRVTCIIYNLIVVSFGPCAGLFLEWPFASIKVIVILGPTSPISVLLCKFNSMKEICFRFKFSTTVNLLKTCLQGDRVGCT